MAIEEDKIEDSDTEVNDHNLSNDDLFCTFEELH